MWIEQFSSRYQQKLTPNISGAKRGLHEGIGQRFDGFKLMFELLLAQKNKNFYIIETGTLRNPGNWKDGQSAWLFTEFVDQHGGRVQSVDIDPMAKVNADSAIRSQNFSCHCSDSVSWLSQQQDLDQVDLFYLDSWDVKWENDQDSAQHHLKEFKAIEPYLKKGSVVAIDDNARFLSTGLRTGKGRCIVEYLRDKNIMPLYDQYQIIYQF